LELEAVRESQIRQEASRYLLILQSVARAECWAALGCPRLQGLQSHHWAVGTGGCQEVGLASQ
jgi:hypothetical protein